MITNVYFFSTACDGSGGMRNIMKYQVDLRSNTTTMKYIFHRSKLRTSWTVKQFK